MTNKASFANGFAAHNSRSISLLLSIVVSLASGMIYPGSSEGRGEDWVQFRGPRGDGTSLATDLPTTWGGVFDTPKWKTSIPGIGWSSPVAQGDRIWVTSAETVSMEEKRQERILEENPSGSVDFQTVESVALLVVGIDAETGEIVDRILLDKVNNPNPIHTTNSYASPTPIVDGRFLYCHFGSLGTYCVDLSDHKVLWKRVFAVDDITGPGASAVLFEDLLIIPCDGADQQYVVAVDSRNGDVRWKAPRPPIEAATSDLKRAFSTPLIAHYQGRTQILSTTAQWIVSYNPVDGKEWWRARIGSGYSLIPRPVVEQGVVFVCSGYMKPVLYAIRMDGTGDVTDSHVMWTRSRQIPEISSPVIANGKIYCVSALGSAICLRSKDGELIWKHRLPGTYSASPLYADGKIYFTSQSGVTTVLAESDKYSEIATNELFGETFASIAVIEQDLLIRTNPFIYRISKSR